MVGGHKILYEGGIHTGFLKKIGQHFSFSFISQDEHSNDLRPIQFENFILGVTSLEYNAIFSAA